MKWVVTGGGGMLAQALRRVGEESGHRVVALDRHRLDVTDEAAVAALLAEEKPDVVIQGAAYTAVDRAEMEPAAAFRVNEDGTRNVAHTCQKLGCVFVYPSTDYVFDGSGNRPYLPSDEPRPINVYGQSKWRGELAAGEADRALIVRTSWLYGAGGSNFVATIARLAPERDEFDVVDDQIGRPTWTVSLASTIGKLLNAGAVGTFHASNGGHPVSWAGVAREILGQLSARAEVRPVSSEELGRAAARPRYSVLDLSATEEAIGHPLPDWRDALAQYLSEARQ